MNSLLRLRPYALRIIPPLVFGSGLLVMLGYLLSVNVLVLIHGNFPVMRFGSALLFTLCGVGLYFFRDSISLKPRYRPHFFTTTFVLCVMTLSVFFMLTFSSASAHLNDFLFFPTLLDPWSSRPSIPSLATLVCFSLTFFAFGLSVFQPSWRHYILRAVGGILVFIGPVAIIGNIVFLPTLFFGTWRASGIAIHSGFLFLLIGIYFFALTVLDRSPRQSS